MKRLILITMTFIVIGCTEQVIEKPKDLIARDKMVDILYDLALLNAAKSINSSVLKESGIETMPYLYTKYDIDSTAFANSDLYYASLPAEYKAMYEEVNDRLESRKNELDEARKVITDSARRRVNQRRIRKEAQDISQKPTDSIP